MTQVTKQADEKRVTVASIVRSKEFAAGVDDVRSGRPPRFDDPVAFTWDYERGRQFAMLAPMRMQVKIDGRVNPKAVALFWRFVKEGSIR
jgi:hypothetical protein